MMEKLVENLAHVRIKCKMHAPYTYEKYKHTVCINIEI